MSMLDVFRTPLPSVSALDAERVELERQLAADEPQLHTLAVDCLLSGDLGPAQALRDRIRAARSRIAAIEVERQEALTAEDKRLEAERAKEIARFQKVGRAKSGELSTCTRQIDDAIGTIARFSAKADDVMGALQSLVGPDVAWPPGSFSLLAEAVDEAIGIAIRGEQPASIEATIEPLREFLRLQFATPEN